MDENFKVFLEDMGPAFDRQYVPRYSLERYRGKLPDQLLNYWDEHGWCGYADGSFWTVNPQDYEPVLHAWIVDTPFIEEDSYHVIARGAFGHLYVWGERSGIAMLISSLSSFALPLTRTVVSLDRQIQMFFSSLDRGDNDFDDYFAPALKKLGRLKADEMYGFVPAMAAGGTSAFEHLQKVKIIEYLVVIAQLTDLQVITQPPV